MKEPISRWLELGIPRRPSNSLFQIVRGSRATLSECTFLESAHHSKISRSATWFLSRKHSTEACFYSTRPEGIRIGFQSSTIQCLGTNRYIVPRVPHKKGRRSSLTRISRVILAVCYPVVLLGLYNVNRLGLLPPGIYKGGQGSLDQ